MTVVRILFAAAFVWFVCLSAGDLLVHALRLKFPNRERIFLGFLTGAALVSTTMFLLATATLVYTGALVVAGMSVIAAWIYGCAGRVSTSCVAWARTCRSYGKSHSGPRS